MNVTTLYDGAVAAAYNVTIPLSEEDADALRAALSVVQKYQQKAAQATKVKTSGKRKNCDWAMYGYAVKNDKVIITVECGACG